MKLLFTDNVEKKIGWLIYNKSIFLLKNLKENIVQYRLKQVEIFCCINKFLAKILTLLSSYDGLPKIPDELHRK